MDVKPGEQPPPYHPGQPDGYPPQQGYPPPQQGYPPPQQGYPPPQQGYPPPQQGYPPPQQGYAQPVASTIVVQQPNVVMTASHFGEFGVNTTCTHCRQNIVTATFYEGGTMMWVVAGVLFIIGCWPCCLIPFCMDSCKDVTHTCPSCNTTLGSFRRM